MSEALLRDMVGVGVGHGWSEAKRLKQAREDARRQLLVHSIEGSSSYKVSDTTNHFKQETTSEFAGELHGAQEVYTCEDKSQSTTWVAISVSRKQLQTALKTRLAQTNEEGRKLMRTIRAELGRNDLSGAAVDLKELESQQQRAEQYRKTLSQFGAKSKVFTDKAQVVRLKQELKRRAVVRLDLHGDQRLRGALSEGLSRGGLHVIHGHGHNAAFVVKGSLELAKSGAKTTDAGRFVAYARVQASVTRASASAAELSLDRTVKGVAHSREGAERAVIRQLAREVAKPIRQHLCASLDICTNTKPR